MAHQRPPHTRDALQGALNAAIDAVAVCEILAGLAGEPAIREDIQGALLLLARHRDPALYAAIERARQAGG